MRPVICPSVRLVICPSVRLVVCLSVRLVVCPSVRLYITSSAPSGEISGFLHHKSVSVVNKSCITWLQMTTWIIWTWVCYSWTTISVNQHISMLHIDMSSKSFNLVPLSVSLAVVVVVFALVASHAISSSGLPYNVRTNRDLCTSTIHYYRSTSCL